jgi:hypothetical protein
LTTAVVDGGGTALVVVVLPAVLPDVLVGANVVAVELEVVVELDDAFNEPPHAARAIPARMIATKGEKVLMYFFNRLPFVAVPAFQPLRIRF